MSNPYDDTTCKIQLYKTLTKLVTNHHWNMSPPLEYSILLLSNGQTSNDPRISSICSTALSNLNSFIHPAFATLQFPLDIEGLKNEFNIDSNKNSHKSPTPNVEETTDCEMEVTESEIPSYAIESVKENTEKSDKEKDKQIESSPQEEKKDASKDKISSESVSEKEKMDIDTNRDKTEEQTKEKEQNSNKTNTDDIIEIPEPKETQRKDEPKETQRNEKKNDKVTSTENENSSRTSYSVHIEILSDDEIMEQLTIEDEPENLDNSLEKENAVSSSSQENTEKNNTENVIDLVEEDMCSAFVDIVNE